MIASWDCTQVICKWHRIHGTCHIWQCFIISTTHAGKYASPVDPIGYDEPCASFFFFSEGACYGLWQQAGCVFFVGGEGGRSLWVVWCTGRNSGLEEFRNHQKRSKLYKRYIILDKVYTEHFSDHFCRYTFVKPRFVEPNQGAQSWFLTYFFVVFYLCLNIVL